MTKKIFQTGLAITTIMLMAGCATALSDANRAQIKKVSINQKVVMPERVTYAGGDERLWATLFPPLSYRFTHGEHAHKLAQLLIDNKIDIVTIFTNRFTTHLKTANIFEIVDSDQADARFSFKITQYGLVGPLGDYFHPRPILTVTGQLTRDQTNVVWQCLEAEIGDAAGLESHLGSEYFKNPELVKTGLERAANIVASNLVHQLKSH